MEFLVKHAEYLTSAAKPQGWPPLGPPEVAFAGRSNVGKSSLINRLTGRKKLVRVGQTPGRTQLINFFALNGDTLRLVDLPGYGFAKVPESVRKAWRPMIEKYLSGRDSLALVVVIVDIRRDLGSEDQMLLGWLASLGIPTLVAATKADKLSNNQAASRLGALRKQLAAHQTRPILFSALSGLGTAEVWARIVAACGLDQPPEAETPPPPDEV